MAPAPARSFLSSKLECARESLTTPVRGHRVRCPLPPESRSLTSYPHCSRTEPLLFNSRTMAMASPSVQEALASIGKSSPAIQCSLSESIVRPWVRNGINGPVLMTPPVKTEWCYYLIVGRTSLSLREVDTTELNTFRFHPQRPRCTWRAKAKSSRRSLER